MFYINNFRDVAMEQQSFNPTYGNEFLFIAQPNATSTDVHHSRPELNHRQLKVFNRQSLELNFKNKVLDRQPRPVTTTESSQIPFQVNVFSPTDTTNLVPTRATLFPDSNIIQKQRQPNSTSLYNVFAQKSGYGLLEVAIPEDYDYSGYMTNALVGVTNNFELENKIYTVESHDMSLPYLPNTQGTLTDQSQPSQTPTGFADHHVTDRIESPGSRSYNSLQSPSPPTQSIEHGNYGVGTETQSGDPPAAATTTPPHPKEKTTPDHTNWPRKGKQIRMNESPPREPEDREDSESEPDVDEDSDGEVSAEVLELFNETEIDESVLLNEIEHAKSVDDPYILTKRRVKMFVKISILVDSKCKNSNLKKSFEQLFVDGIPDFRSRWKKLNLKVPVLSNVPAWLRWILVYICLCFGTNVNRKSITEELNKTIKKFSETKYSITGLLLHVSSFIGIVTSKRHKKSRGDYIDGQHGSPGNSRMGSPNFQQPASTSFYLQPPPPQSSKNKYSPRTCGNESDVGSQSDNSVSGKKRRISNMEQLAKQYPVRRRVAFSQDRPTSSASSRSYQCDQTCGVTDPRPTSDRELQRDDVFSASDIIFYPSIDSWSSKQKLTATMKPNKHISEATRDVVTELITQSEGNKEIIVSFGEMLKSLVKKITLRIMGKSSFDLHEMLGALKASDDVNEKEAISICISLYSTIHSGERNLVSVSWRSLVKWIEDFSKSLNDEIVRITLKRTQPGQDNEMKSEFPEFRRKMEANMMSKYSELLPVFEKLSSINDMCLYMLFGLNILKVDNNTMYTDLLVKSILLAWQTKGQFPISERGDGLYNVFWCLPLAYLTKLRGFGAIARVDGVEDAVCSIDDFMEAGMEITRS